MHITARDQKPETRNQKPGPGPGPRSPEQSRAEQSQECQEDKISMEQPNFFLTSEQEQDSFQPYTLSITVVQAGGQVRGVWPLPLSSHTHILTYSHTHIPLTHSTTPIVVAPNDDMHYRLLCQYSQSGCMCACVWCRL